MLHSRRSIARSLEESFELTSCKCVSFGEGSFINNNIHQLKPWAQERYTRWVGFAEVLIGAVLLCAVVVFVNATLASIYCAQSRRVI